MKKPFKETRVGKLICEKLPDAIAIVGEVLPDKGVLGIAKNIIDKSTLTPEEKEELNKELLDFELEVMKLEMQDRASARTREVEMAKTGGKDWMMYVAGLVGLGAFVFMIIILAFWSVPTENKELFIHGLGIVEGIAVSIVAYYYGTSKSSADKNEIIKQQK
jgi:hypothetical protein